MKLYPVPSSRSETSHLIHLISLHKNYRCRELWRQEVTAKISQYNENYFKQLIHTVTEINDIETDTHNIYLLYLLQKCSHKTPQCYVKRTPPVLLCIQLAVPNTRTAVTM